MAGESSGAEAPDVREKALLNGRLAVVYSLSRFYLFVPFAVLCMAAAPLRNGAAIVWSSLPFILLIAAMVFGTRLKQQFDARDADSDPAPWARRYTILSGFTGAIWGLGAIVWFDSTSFAAEAYLVLAFLGLSATEFIPRAAYRTAYLAHAIGSLVPLALLLAAQGGVYQLLSAMLVLYFGAVLYSYGATLGELLDESTVLRQEHGELILRLGQEKRLAEQTRDTAQESDRAKSTFVSNISHELRTPLNAILGMAQVLERSDLEKAQRDHVKVLLEAGRGLKILLDDIIALASQDEDSRVPAGGCDGAQAARTVARLLQPNAWEKRLRLSINIAPGLPHIAADARLIRRVLLKLIGNAIKFTDRGNVEIALDSAEGSSGRKMVRFVITDTGPGIPGSLMSVIFEPFGKGHGSNAVRNTGVGLAVAKRLIESIGGKIGVESEPGMGASFWITVPAAEGAAVQDAQTSEAAIPPAGLNLLAFLPDPTMRTVLTQLLSPFGNQITFVESLVQAVTVSSRGNFAAVIAPADSIATLAAAPGQHMPILALVSGEERLPDGADGVLRWPSSPDALYSAVNAVTGETEAAAAEEKQANVEAMIDAKVIAELEKSLGLKTLIDILQSYLHTAEGLATTLTAATQQSDWTQAARVAQDFVGAAGGLGLTAVTQAARALSLAARDDPEARIVAAATNEVLSQHGRVREALRRLYPDLAA